MLSKNRKVLLSITVFHSPKFFVLGSISVSRFLDPNLQIASLMPWVQSKVLLQYSVAQLTTTASLGDNENYQCTVLNKNLGPYN